MSRITNKQKIIIEKLDTEKTYSIESKGRLIDYSEKQIKYYINIEEISERIIAGIPVKVINIPDNIRVFPSPQTVALTVIGGLRQISKLKAEEIDVI